MSKGIAASIQYLGIALIVFAIFLVIRSGAYDAGARVPMGFAVPGIALTGIGTVWRISVQNAERRRASRRTLIKPRPGVAPRATTQPGVEAVPDDLSRAITPAMLNELQDSGPWMTGFAVLLGIAALMVIAGGALAMFAGILDGSRLGIVIGIGVGIAELLIGSLELMLFSYVRQHRRAIAAAGDRLTETKLIAIVDSQRRIWRFFGTMLSFLGGLAVLLFLAGFVSGALRALL